MKASQVAFYLFFGLALFALYNVYVISTIPSYQLKLDAVGKRNEAHDVLTDPYKLSERLKGAIRIPTISYEDHSKIDYQQFLNLHIYIKNLFPQVHSKLKKEIIANYSLLYTWEGTDKDLHKSFMLTAHMDVVPIEEGTDDRWTNKPFDGTISDGYIWGRGTLDDKHNIIAIMEAIEHLLSTGFKPRHTIYIGFGHDEEISGRNGAKNIAKLLEERGVQLEFLLDEGLLIAEKGMVPLVDSNVALIGTTEKGYLTLDISVEGKGGHSSFPPNNGTAIGVLAAAVNKLESQTFPASTSFVKKFHQHLASHMNLPGKILVSNGWLYDIVIQMIAKNMPVLNAQLRTTTAVTIFQAGMKENAIPSLAKAVVNFRVSPAETIDSVVERVRSIISDDRVKIEIRSDTRLDPAPITSEKELSYKILSKTIHQIFHDVLVAPSIMMANTDTRYYWNLTKNIFRFSPTLVNSTEGIHGTNERIDVINYANMVNFYNHFIRNSDNDIIDIHQ